MRISSVSTTIVTVVVGIGALALVAGPHALAQTDRSAASAVLRTASGDEVGRVTFAPAEAGGVVVSVKAENLPPGFHGFHLHSAAQCDGPDFTSAGGHFDPMAMAHQPMHAGDLPSLLINEDGTGRMTAVSDRFNIDDLLAGAGTAAIVHANADNFANIPSRYAPVPDATTLSTGDAGARIACGIVQPA